MIRPSSCLRGRGGTGLNEFDDLPVHERLSVLHLDEHRSELALPQVSKHALGRQGQVGLWVVTSPGEDFLKQWCVQGEIGPQTTPSDGSKVRG